MHELEIKVSKRSNAARSTGKILMIYSHLLAVQCQIWNKIQDQNFELMLELCCDAENSMRTKNPLTTHSSAIKPRYKSGTHNTLETDHIR